MSAFEMEGMYSVNDGFHIIFAHSKLCSVIRSNVVGDLR